MGWVLTIARRILSLLVVWQRCMMSSSPEDGECRHAQYLPGATSSGDGLLILVTRRCLPERRRSHVQGLPLHYQARWQVEPSWHVWCTAQKPASALQA